VDHLRWDMRQIFNMAIAEGFIQLNPAALLFTPKDAKRPKHPTMSVEQTTAALRALDTRESLIAKLAILSGMRPGEIFGLTWGRLAEASAEVTQRVYRNKIDTPKTHQSLRKAAITDGMWLELDQWRSSSRYKSDQSFVFSSERGTALSKDNVWRRNMQPALAKVGLGWVNFQVNAADPR